MKKMSFWWLRSLLLAWMWMIILPGCSKNDHPVVQQDDMYNLNASLSGSNEVPVNSTPGTGTVTGNYNATKNLFSYNISWSGITGTATAGHFHSPALAGANASPLVYLVLQNNGSSGTASGSATLSDAQEADLLAGKFYANIHTSANGGGEIRGQVVASK